ncbi:MAG: hypothetical protein M3O64_02155, partial [Chloroflexota bacterium]|nr:hypothetical protein [Chloroflexota bacterium]
MASVLRLPGSMNVHLSPDGRFIEVDASETFVYDLTGRAVACLTGESSHAEGWLPDSSAVLIRVAKSGGRDLTGPTEFALLGVNNRITRLGVPAPFYGPGGLVYWTSDARSITVVDGTGLKIASQDGTAVVTVDPSSTAAPAGWLDDRHLLYYRPGADYYPVYRIADLAGVTTDATELNARHMGYGVLAAPDGKSAVLMATGPSTPIFSALIASNGTLRELDIQMIFGWSGPHELIARRGGSVVAVDLPSGAMRTIGPVDPDLSF